MRTVYCMKRWRLSMRFSKSVKTARITQFPVHKRIGVMLGEENQVFSFKVLGPVAGRQCCQCTHLKKRCPWTCNVLQPRKEKFNRLDHLKKMNLLQQTMSARLNCRLCTCRRGKAGLRWMAAFIFTEGTVDFFCLLANL